MMFRDVTEPQLQSQTIKKYAKHFATVKYPVAERRAELIFLRHSLITEEAILPHNERATSWNYSTDHKGLSNLLLVL